jgi:hypothetical protein
MKYIAFLAALIAALVLAPPAAAAADWAWPVRGDVVTPYKNGDDPYAGGQHRGIDIAAPVGTRVNAAVDGRVTFAGVAGSSGLTVNMRTGDGRFDVSYLHLSSAVVHNGDELDRGEALGAVGTSGRRSVDQPHLHFGVREAGDEHAYRDPLDFLPPLAGPVTDPPSAVPVDAPDPVAAPPASAPRALAASPALAAPATAASPAPAGDPAPAEAGHLPQLTTAVLAPLPSPSAVLGTADPERRAAGAAPDRAGHTPGRAEATPRARGSASAPHGAPRAHGSASSSPSAPRAEDGSLQDPTRARGAGSPSHRSVGVRLVSRADLSSPARTTSRRSADDVHAEPRFDIADRRSVGPKRAEDGLNVGWLAAVIGLVAASLCLSRPRRARDAAHTSRSAIGAVLRPLTGRG